jgi:hypothetical protein
VVDFDDALSRQLLEVRQESPYRRYPRTANKRTSGEDRRPAKATKPW